MLLMLLMLLGLPVACVARPRVAHVASVAGSVVLLGLLS